MMTLTHTLTCVLLVQLHGYRAVDVCGFESRKTMGCFRDSGASHTLERVSWTTTTWTIGSWLCSSYRVEDSAPTCSVKKCHH
ncbi:hypothetical protein B0I72DRAFT_141234 [Yarrowia lipolytica]|nr:hypothetical protein B0I72DRAFT_141234 [Yarrowia lipolytica]